MDRTERTGINEIASIVSTKHEKIAKEDASLFLKRWIDVISDLLAMKKQMEVNGFGTFDFSQVRERETTEQIEAGNEEVAYYYKIGFTPHETLRNSVNIFFSNFEPSLLNEGVTFDNLPEVIAGEKHAEEYIYNHLQKMVSHPNRLIGETEILAAEEIPETEIPETEETQVVETPVIETPTAEPSETVFPPTDIPSTETRSNVLSESLHQLSAEPAFSDISTFRQRVRKRAKRHPVWVPILGGMAIIVAALFFSGKLTKKTAIIFNRQALKTKELSVGNHTGRSAVSNPSKEASSPYEGVQLLKSDTIAEEQHKSTADPATDNAPHKPATTTAAAKSVERIRLAQGQTLRLLALDLFGSREFWVYIYLENRNSIRNPDVVPSGTQLVIPDPVHYNINASDPQSVDSARELGKKILDS